MKATGSPKLLARHERFLAQELRLGRGMVAADLGCGVGGALIEIARYSVPSVVGVNSNGYQLERAHRYTEEAGLTHLVDFLHYDFLDVDAPDESLDAVYSIEATCCAPNKLSIYGEAYRLLKLGARFAVLFTSFLLVLTGATIAVVTYVVVSLTVDPSWAGTGGPSDRNLAPKSSHFSLTRPTTLYSNLPAKSSQIGTP